MLGASALEFSITDRGKAVHGWKGKVAFASIVSSGARHAPMLQMHSDVRAHPTNNK